HDYLYISLGGSKKGAFRKYLNLFIVAVAFALWHGIEIKFIAFALLHLLLYCHAMRNQYLMRRIL
ncbi:MAG: MBOAT family protein, partial [Mogibacterium sp.]|nr:MBOAT family protein [Mogibacterium sp.]